MSLTDERSKLWMLLTIIVRTASSEFRTYRLCEQRRFRRACASAQSRQNHRCSFIQAVSQEEPSDRKSDPWHLWMAGHAQLKFLMTECLKTQIRLTGLVCTMFAGVTMFSEDPVLLHYMHRMNLKQNITLAKHTCPSLRIKEVYAQKRGIHVLKYLFSCYTINFKSGLPCDLSTAFTTLKIFEVCKTNLLVNVAF